MPRIQAIDPKSTEGETADILSNVKQELGMIPNIVATMAQSPAVANSHLAFSSILGGGTLSRASGLAVSPS